MTTLLPRTFVTFTVAATIAGVATQSFAQQKNSVDGCAKLSPSHIELTDVEQKVWRKLCTTGSFGPSQPAEPKQPKTSPCRGNPKLYKVRGAFLSFILRNHSTRAQLKKFDNVYLRCLEVSDSVDLYRAKIEPTLSIRWSKFDGSIQLLEATVSNGVDLSFSTFTNKKATDKKRGKNKINDHVLGFENFHTNGNVILNGIKTNFFINFDYANIAGNLEIADGVELNRPSNDTGARTLWIGSAQIGGDLKIGYKTSGGSIEINSSDVKKSVWIKPTRDAGNATINLKGTKIGSALIVEGWSAASGAKNHNLDSSTLKLSLESAKIGGDLKFEKIYLRSLDGRRLTVAGTTRMINVRIDSLNFQRAKFIGNYHSDIPIPNESQRRSTEEYWILMNARRNAICRAFFNGAEFQSNFDLANNDIVHLDLSDITVSQKLIFRRRGYNFSLPGAPFVRYCGRRLGDSSLAASIILNGVNTKVLVMSRTMTANSDQRSIYISNLRLDRFGVADDFACPEGKSNKCIPKPRSPNTLGDSGHLLRLVDLAKGTAMQPYESIAAALRRHGLSEAAKQAIVDGFEKRRAKTGDLWESIGLLLTYWFAGYGQWPWLAGFWLVGLIFFSSLIIWSEDAYHASNNSNGSETDQLEAQQTASTKTAQFGIPRPASRFWSCVYYVLDLSVPFVRFDDAHFGDKVQVAPWVPTYMVFHRLFCYVLAAAFGIAIASLAA